MKEDVENILNEICPYIRQTQGLRLRRMRDKQSADVRDDERRELTEESRS